MSEFIESSNLMFLELDKHLETLISAFKGGPNLGSSSNSGKMTPETVGFVLLFFSQNLKCDWFGEHCLSICESTLSPSSDKLNFVG